MAIATSISNLIAALTTAAGDIVNNIDRFDCLVLIDEYALAKTAEASSTSSNISSYTIAGRTVQYRTLGELNDRVSQLRSGINSYLHGGQGAVVDNRIYVSAL